MVAGCWQQNVDAWVQRLQHSCIMHWVLNLLEYGGCMCVCVCMMGVFTNHRCCLPSISHHGVEVWPLYRLQTSGPAAGPLASTTCCPQPKFGIPLHIIIVFVFRIVLLLGACSLGCKPSPFQGYLYNIARLGAVGGGEGGCILSCLAWSCVWEWPGLSCQNTNRIAVVAFAHHVGFCTDQHL